MKNLLRDRLRENSTFEHRYFSGGLPTDREQITVAAFLNLYIAWESFIEDILTKLMSGSPTISGSYPVRYVCPPSQEAAKDMVKGINRYFDYANYNYILKIAEMYFENGYPFKDAINSFSTDFNDLRIMRNCSAHITSTTQRSLDAIAQRIFSTPHPGIKLYTFLTMEYPNLSKSQTVYSNLREKLLVAADVIAWGKNM